MKKTIKSLKSIALLGLILVISISCDKEFANIESNIEGIKNFNATSKLFPLTATTKNFNPFNSGNGIQTNGLQGSSFGVYKSPTTGFGTTVASVTTQVVPENYAPEFGDNPVFESVDLYIPYFSTVESTDDDENNTYTLDSIFGNPDVEFKLSIYKSNYVLRDLDPNTDFLTRQCYFSSQGDLFETSAELIYEDLAFKILPDEITEGTGDDIVRFAPGIKLNLLNSGPNPINIDDNITFWQNIFFDNEGNEVLSTEGDFKNFFRGLIIKVENTNSDGAFTFLNFSGGRLEIEYTNDEEAAATEENEYSGPETVYNLNFIGNRVNTFETTGITNQNDNEDNLYLRGGEGSMAVIDLFNGDVENDEGLMVPALDFFNSKKEKWLLNQVNLIFYVDQTLLNGDEPERLALYDLKNNVPIIDYFLDPSTNLAQPNNSKTSFSESLKKDESGKGLRYKFRITDHIKNILLRDSTNTKLGLYVANNVNVVQLSKVEDINIDDDDETLDLIPSTTILSPKGTILYGSKESIPVGQRVEFEIFYTEPEN